MAVQAQYPSNVLLFNRNGQDSKNMLSSINNSYPVLQPSSQPGTASAVAGGNNGGFLLDQSHHLILSPNGVAVGNALKNNNTNRRKRGRDVMATTATAATTTTTSTAANNHHHHQHHYTHTNPSLQNHHHPPQQLIELSRLQQPPPNPGVSTGLKLSFGDHHQILQQMQPNHHSLTTNNNNQYSLPSPVLIPLLSSDHLVNQINQQSNDLNQLIHAHVEQLQRTVAQKQQRHYQTLLTAVEESLAQRLQEKESQLEKAARRHAELEARAAQLSAEAQLWQAKARAQEAQAASLQAQLQQAMMLANGAPSKPAVDGDGILGCSEGGDAEDAESAYIDPDRVVVTTMPETAVPGCRACGVRAATVVILPCRHLCVCVECDGVVQACPVCIGMRNSSVEVFLT